MKSIRSFLALLVCCTALQGITTATQASGANTGEEGTVTTVSNVDLERYLGLWYEIAKIPNRFQKKCVRGTTAEYALRDDGRISVVNRCMKEDGSLDEAEGVAKIVDGSGNAKLKVSFFSLLGWRPFWGNYWVIGLAEGYQWAVIGTPDRKYGWVLSRSPSLDAEAMEQIFAIIERNGYQSDVFEMSQQ